MNVKDLVIGQTVISRSKKMKKKARKLPKHLKDNRKITTPAPLPKKKSTPDVKLVDNPNPKGRKEKVTKEYRDQWLNKNKVKKVKPKEEVKKEVKPKEEKVVTPPPKTSKPEIEVKPKEAPKTSPKDLERKKEEKRLKDNAIRKEEQLERDWQEFSERPGDSLYQYGADIEPEEYAKIKKNLGTAKQNKGSFLTSLKSLFSSKGESFFDTLFNKRSEKATDTLADSFSKHFKVPKDAMRKALDFSINKFTRSVGSDMDEESMDYLFDDVAEGLEDMDNMKSETPEIELIDTPGSDLAKVAQYVTSMQFLRDFIQDMQIGASLETAKPYTVDYIIKNPPNPAKGMKVVWEEAVREYLRRKKVKFNKNAKIDNMEWNEVMRLFNTLRGKKNKQRDPEKKKMGKQLQISDLKNMKIGATLVVSKKFQNKAIVIEISSNRLVDKALKEASLKHKKAGWDNTFSNINLTNFKDKRIEKVNIGEYSVWLHPKDGQGFQILKLNFKDNKQIPMEDTVDSILNLIDSVIKQVNGRAGKTEMDNYYKARDVIKQRAIDKKKGREAKAPKDWHKDWKQYWGKEGKRKLFMQVYNATVKKLGGVDVTHSSVTNAMKKLNMKKPKGQQVKDVVTALVKYWEKKNNPYGDR